MQFLPEEASVLRKFCVFLQKQKNRYAMKRFFYALAVVLLTATGSLKAQTQEYTEAINWTLQRSWSNGFKALPEVCTNLIEFKSQYEKNRAQWDAAFKWLATHDLNTIAAGQHPIEGTTLVASVEDSQNDPLEKRGNESHYYHIDLQYVVKGCERFGLLDHATSKALRYKPDCMNYECDMSKTMFIDSTPERFFLFFPGDWHIAKVATDKDSQDIRVIVIKLDYVK